MRHGADLWLLTAGDEPIDTDPRLLTSWRQPLGYCSDGGSLPKAAGESGEVADAGWPVHTRRSNTGTRCSTVTQPPSARQAAQIPAYIMGASTRWMYPNSRALRPRMRAKLPQSLPLLRPLWFGAAHCEECLGTQEKVRWIPHNKYIAPLSHHNKQLTRPAVFLDGVDFLRYAGLLGHTGRGKQH